MQVSVYLTLFAAVLLALVMPLVASRLSPAMAARTLALSALTSAAASTWALALLAMSTIARTPFGTERHAGFDPVPLLIGAAAGVLLLAALSRAAATAARRTRVHRSMRRICELCAPAGELAVLTDPVPQAYAVPGRRGRGRILVSTGLLRSATAGDRRVVLAHERAHLHHRHHVLHAAVDIAAALNPLLHRARRSVQYALERWADEEAASCVGSRTTTAATLAKIALAIPLSGQSSVLAFHQRDVLERVRALHAPPTRSLSGMAALCVVPAVVGIAAAGDATLALAKMLSSL